VNSGAKGTYSYDAWRRRIKRVSMGSTTTKYIPAGSGQLLTEYGVTGGWNRDYVYLNGQLIARISSSGSEGTLYVINDHLGTPMAMVDSAKTIRWKARWNPFGQLYSEFVSSTNDVRFPGQFRDDESGLYYNWHRYYSPKIGRYYQADPIGLAGGTNLYGYTGGNPLMSSDPSGLDWSDSVLRRIPTLPHWFVNGSAGFGDALLAGFGPRLRRLIGADGVVDRCSESYYSGTWLGFILDLAVGAKWGLSKAGAKTAETEFSHFVPTRILKKWFGRDFKNLFNGNYVEPDMHFKMDPFRYLSGSSKSEKTWSTARMLAYRFPKLDLGMILGAGYGLLGTQFEW
jgi:RHS repeat-associated protein